MSVFLMHNREYPLVLLAENWAEERTFPLYFEYSDGLSQDVAG